MSEQATIRAGVGLGGMLLLCACGSDTLIALQTVKDEFVQNTAAMVDILWVVDNSSSMGEEQNGLAQSFNAFINNLVLSGVDYHVGVVATDSPDGTLHQGAGMPVFVSPATGVCDCPRTGGSCSAAGVCSGTAVACMADNACATAAAAFAANVRVGTAGGLQEKGFESASRVLGKGPGWDPTTDLDPVPVPNPGFLRRGVCAGTCEGTDVTCTSHADCDKAALLIVFVSDEDDGSFGAVRYYWRLFEGYLGAGNEALIKIGAIVGPANNPVTGLGGGCYDAQRGLAYAGDRYTELVLVSASTSETAAQSIVASICEDFNESLTALSITAAGLKSVFTLSKKASQSATIPCSPLAAGPFCVKVDNVPVAGGGAVGSGWLFDAAANAIVFAPSALPPPQSTITVEYQEIR